MTIDVNSPDSSQATDVSAAVAAETDSSTVTQSTDVTEPSSSPEGVKTAPKSLLDAVKTALKPADAPTSDQVASTSPAEKSSSETDPSPDPETISTDEKDYAKEPFGKHPRFKKVLNALKERDAEIEALKTQDTERSQIVSDFETFRGAVQQANLGADEVSRGFAIMAMMKQDPVQALEMLKPWVDALENQAGVRIPADIQAKIDAGVIDDETGLALSRERARNQHLTQRERQFQQREQQTSQQSQQERWDAVRNSMAQAASSWEQEWKRTDPDYLKKQPLVQAEVAQLLHAKQPTSPEEAVALAKLARANVEKYLADMMPARTSTRTVTGGNSGLSSAVPKPKTLAEAVRLAANGG